MNLKRPLTEESGQNVSVLLAGKKVNGDGGNSFLWLLVAQHFLLRGSRSRSSGGGGGDSTLSRSLQAPSLS